MQGDTVTMLCYKDHDLQIIGKNAGQYECTRQRARKWSDPHFLPRASTSK